MQITMIMMLAMMKNDETDDYDDEMMRMMTRSASVATLENGDGKGDNKVSNVLARLALALCCTSLCYT